MLVVGFVVDDWVGKKLCGHEDITCTIMLLATIFITSALSPHLQFKLFLLSLLISHLQRAGEVSCSYLNYLCNVVSQFMTLILHLLSKKIVHHLF